MSQQDTRTRVVDAAERCFERFGLAKTTVDDIATASGISRATIYRSFGGGRDEIVLAVIMREADRFVARLHEHVDFELPLPTVVIEATVFTLHEVQANPTFAMLYAPDAAGHALALVGGSEALFGLIRELLGPVVDRARAAGHLRPGLDIDDIGEFLERIVISLLTIPSPKDRDDDDLRRFLDQFVLPALLPDDVAGRRSSVGGDAPAVVAGR